VRRRQVPPALKRHARLKDPRRPAALMHACIVVSLMAGVRPEEARAIGWAEDVDLDGNPASVAVLRADRAGGDTKTPRSRRALKLARMAVGALGEEQVDQAAEREAAGSRWRDTGRVFTTATGTPLAARHIRKMFRDVCERAGFGGDWAPRDLRHTGIDRLTKCPWPQRCCISASRLSTGTGSPCGLVVMSQKVSTLESTCGAGSNSRLRTSASPRSSASTMAQQWCATSRHSMVSACWVLRRYRAPSSACKPLSWMK